VSAAGVELHSGPSKSSGSGANAVPTGGQGMMELDRTVGRAELPRVSTMTTSFTVLPFLSLLRRGVTIDVHAEAGDERCLYVTSTEILDSDPDGEGGVVLTLDATIEDGRLDLPEAVIATAQEGAGRVGDPPRRACIPLRARRGRTRVRAGRSVHAQPRTIRRAPRMV
jgi:hypothetical protein